MLCFMINQGIIRNINSKDIIFAYFHFVLTYGMILNSTNTKPSVAEAISCIQYNIHYNLKTAIVVT